MKERKKRIEHKLGKLGVNMEKMQEATEELKIPYCRTKERESRIKKKNLKEKLRKKQKSANLKRQKLYH